MIKTKTRYNFGFTIVEMIIVIVIIGILTTISVVSYNGIQAKARNATLLSDIDNMDEAQTNYALKHGGVGKVYNSSLGTDPDLEFTPNEGNVIDVVVVGDEYCIRAYNPNSTKKTINNSYQKESAEGACDIITIGTQVWKKFNLNVGNVVTAGSGQIDDGVVQKWCHDNDENNCNTYGGLYQWAEAVQYQNGATNTTPPSPAFSGNIQGICPTGFHVPTDNEFKTLEIYLGMNPVDADINGWRGTDQATQLISGGSSGFNALFGGQVYSNGTFDGYLGVKGYFWTTSYLSGDYTWARHVQSGLAQVFRFIGWREAGLSVRCIKD